MLKITKALTAIFLSVVLLGGISTAYANDYLPPPDPTPTERPIANPKVKLVTPSVVTIRNGSQQDVEITIKNVGSSFANTVLTQATVTGDSPISLQFLNNSNAFSSIYEGVSKKATLRIKVDPNAADGNYPITLTHSFKNIYNSNFSDTDTITVRVVRTDKAPSMVMENFSSSLETVAPGEKFTVSANIINASELDAKEVQVKIEGLEPDKIYLADSTTSTYFRQFYMAANERVSYSFAASSKIKSGSYPITFKITYLDAKNEKHEKEFLYYVSVSGAPTEESKATVEVKSILEPKGEYKVAEEFAVKLNLANTSQVDAKNVKVTAVMPEGGVIVPKSSSIQMINQLKAAETKEVSFSFAPTASAKTQNYVIGFKVEYEPGVETDKDIVVYTFEQFAGVNVNNPENKEKPEDTKISKPKIIVSSYKSDPIIVKAGEEFSLDMEFKNTHPTKSIENVKAVLTALETTEKKGSVFTPVDGSNTFYIDKIMPNQTASKNFKMFTVPDADPRTYTISVKFKYQDADFNEYEEEEIIGINVKQITRLETNAINMPTESMVGAPIYLYFNIMNTGKVALSNLKVNIEGNFDTANSFVFFGTIAKSSSASYDGSFIPNEVGSQEGKIIIEYDDDTGEHMVEEKPFTINVIDAPPMPEGGGMEMYPGMEGKPGFDMGRGGNQMGMPGQGGLSSIQAYARNPYVWVGGVITLLGIIFGYKKFKKRKSVSFDE